MLSRKSSWLMVATALSGLGAPMFAYGQATQPVQAAAQDASGLEEIVVTSQRREQKLQSVPLSVVAIGASQMKERAIVSVEGLDHMVPNVVIEHVGLFRNSASLSMRGDGYAGVESFTDPEVAVYFNGIYQGRNATSLSSTLDVSSVEVLRGPQGTLYGRNAFAGAVSVQTNKPQLTDFSGTASMTFGNYGEVDGELIANIPIVNDKAAARLAFRAHNMDGYYTNNGIVGAGGAIDSTLQGQEIGFEKNYVIRPSFRLTPNDDWDITFSGDIFIDRSQANPQGHIVLPGSTLAAAGFPGFNPFGDESRGISGDGSDPYSVGFSLANKPSNFDQYSFTVDSAYHTDIGTFRVLLNYQDSSSEVWSDTDGENINIFSSARYEDYSAYSAELQYVSDFSDKWDVIGGLFFFHDEYQTTQLTFTGTAPGPAVFTPVAGTAYINNSGKRTSFAPYAQVEYHLTDQLSFVLGGRYSYERKYDQKGENTTLAAAGISTTADFSQHAYSTVPGVVFGPISQSWGNFAPRVGVNYKLTEDILLFGFWQRAFKSGGFNANSTDQTGFNTPYGVERADNYEVGIKSEWLDHKLRVNLNGFYTNYTGLQRSLVTPTSTSASGVTTVTTNAADLTSYGFELETAYKPIEQLTLFANLGWDRAYYTSYCAPLAGLQTTTTPAVGSAACGAIRTVATSAGNRYLVPADYSSLTPIRAPKWDITFGFTKDFTIPNQGMISLTTSANYRSAQYVNLLNVPYSYSPSAVLLDSSLTWEPDNGHYKVTLWGRNLTNELRILNYLPVGSSFADFASTNPQTYGVTFTAQF